MQVPALYRTEQNECISSHLNQFQILILIHYCVFCKYHNKKEIVHECNNLFGVFYCLQVFQVLEIMDSLRPANGHHHHKHNVSVSMSPFKDHNGLGSPSMATTTRLDRTSLRRNVSKGNLLGDRIESKVLVIYTGGTIGMMRNSSHGENKKPKSLYTIQAPIYVDNCMYLHAIQRQIKYLSIRFKNAIISRGIDKPYHRVSDTQLRSLIRNHYLCFLQVYTVLEIIFCLYNAFFSKWYKSALDKDVFRMNMECLLELGTHTNIFQHQLISNDRFMWN